jgi:2',3'-cyclic-nucleotide 2'-phosphodiesterase (5'-nucleotidase family)
MLLQRILYASLLIYTVSCKPVQQQQTLQLKFEDYRIEKSRVKDTAIAQWFTHYKDSVNKVMNKVIGTSANGLNKQQPESGLGNFMADCMREMAQKTFATRVDAAFVNYGGIRSYLPKGAITTGHIYELMPFDNLIVLQKVKGNVLQLFLNRTAEKGGWPVSGLTMQLKDGKATNILIDGKPLQPEAEYTIANSDYIANGGDDCFMLRDVPQINKGYLFRDALIQYVTTLQQQGKTIDWNLEGRVKTAQ